MRFAAPASKTVCSGAGGGWWAVSGAAVRRAYHAAVRQRYARAARRWYACAMSLRAARANSTYVRCRCITVTSIANQHT